MNFDLTDDQEALRDGIRAVCQGRFTSERVRAGFDRGVWDELAETGVFSLIADGFSWADAAIAFEELGRAVVPGPLVWGVLAHGLVDGIPTGLARPAAGAPAMVEHLAAADAVVILDGDTVRSVAASAVSGALLDWPLDPLTPITRVDTLPEGEPVAGADGAQWNRAGAVLTAAFQAGMAHACVEQATEYSLARRQFDRPIGSFQAIKHLLADALVRAEVARTAVHAAAVTLDDPEVGDVDRAIRGAKLLAGEAALKNAKTSVQVHGGMGFTWEVDAHLYLKRAWLTNTAFGTPDACADALAASLG
ncbi:MAG: acyl-CoA dehydrogenase [Actinobacteria bacterium]|nr:acyl-CoA dehydrogenase [Actinomycetota bacterium]